MKYKRMSQDEMRRRMKEKADREGRGGGNLIKVPSGVKIMEIKKGSYNFDIIPFVSEMRNYPDKVDPGIDWPVFTFFIHRGIGAGDNNSYVCPKETFGNRCPICEFINDAQLKKSMSWEELNPLRPKQQELRNIIDLNEKDAPLKILWTSFYNFGKVLNENLERIAVQKGTEKYWGYATLDNGFSLECWFTEKTMPGARKPFSVLSTVNFIDREPYEEEILDETVDLIKCVNVLSYDELFRIFNAIDPDELIPGEEGYQQAAQTQKDENVSSGRRRRAKQEEPEKEPEDDPELEPETLSKRRRVVNPEPKEEDQEDGQNEPENGSDSDDGLVCPDKKGTFGIDNSQLEACIECDIWKECKTAQREKAKVAQQSKKEEEKSEETTSHRRGRRPSSQRDDELEPEAEPEKRRGRRRE